MITHGDVLDVLQGTPDEVYSGCFCDPPYGLGETPDMTEVLTHWLAGDDYKARGGGFMGKGWDSFVPGPAIWKEVYRVLKPGAILMAFGGTRTADLLSIAIRLAGFERFDELMYLYGSGFPKSTDISKAIDKEAGAEREVVGPKIYADGKPRTMGANDTMHEGWQRPWRIDDPQRGERLTAPATDAARTWQGYGTALKPAHEPVLLFRKPRRATYAQTALEHGTGCLNIDGGRIEINDTGGVWGAKQNSQPGSNGHTMNDGWQNGYQTQQHPQGRWPANVVLDDEAARLLDAQSGESKSPNKPVTQGGRKSVGGIMNAIGDERNGLGIGYGDTGGASRYFQKCSISEADRFFYCAKSSRAEREAGLEGLPLRGKANQYGDGLNSATKIRTDEQQENGVDRGGARNNHPCCKPLKLTEYLARLIVPPVEYRDDARLLVPFCGSGSEMIGAYRAGWLHVDGIDNEADYIEIAERRIAHELSKLEQFEQQLRLI